MTASPLRYADVHAHLCDDAFLGEEDVVAARAREAGLDLVIVNGTGPASNRRVLELALRHEHLAPALGIYPVDAVAHRLDLAQWPFGWPAPEPFDPDAEVAFIDSVAPGLIAIGECGLDMYWVQDQAEEQERVLRSLVRVALKHDLPLILHSRKAEARTFEVVSEMGVRKACFHCWGGKARLAQTVAEAGYYLSIPPVVTRSDAFQVLVRRLPLDRLLTETDSPYQGPDAGVRNEPAFVPRGVQAMAAVRGIPVEAMAEAIRESCRRLFGR